MTGYSFFIGVPRCFTMSQLRSFTIVGDSNIKRNVTKTNTRACPQLSGAQVLSCQKIELLDEVLGRVRKESTICIISCITNFLTSSEEDSMVSKRIEPVLDEFLTILTSACSGLPAMAFLLAPPMYRKSPLWYREGLPEVMTRFSAAFKDKPANLHLLPSFPTPDYEQDGCHLTAYSGLEYMIHLFDSSVTLLDDLSKSCDERIPVSNEATRLLEDRVMVLEQDHRRLNEDVELRAAVDAELHDYHENVGNEAFFMITGCPRRPGLTSREWQERVKRDLSRILQELMGREIPIDYVTNATGPRPDAPVRYNVRLTTVEASEQVRTKFGSFFPNGRDERPPFFKDRDISIRNLVTQSTRVRLAILQVIGKRYRESNQGSKVQVINYKPRPLLRIIPPQGSESRKVQNFHFIDAIKKFPTTFSKTDLDFILSKVGYKQKGQLKSLFVVINDDMIRKRDKRATGANAVPVSDSARVSEAAQDQTINNVADRESGDPMDLTPPIASIVTQPSGSRSESDSSRSRSGSRTSEVRAGKRGPPTPPTPQPEKTSRV